MTIDIFSQTFISIGKQNSIAMLTASLTQKSLLILIVIATAMQAGIMQ
jgi:hypothetical protein